MAIITITRGLHSGGEEVAQAIAGKIGARCVSNEVLREAAQKFGVSEAKVEGAFDKSPTFWERMTESSRIYVAYVQATLGEWAKDDNLVYHGNAGQELLREVPHVLKVRLMYPIEARIQTIMEKFKYSREQAMRYVQQIDDDRTKRMLQLHNVDWRDSRRYDVTFNIDHLTSQHVVDIILDLIEQPEFKLTEAKVGAFNDFVIKTRVYTLMVNSFVGRLNRITVTVRDGVVKLEGMLTSSSDFVGEMVEQVRRMEGVKRVDNHIVMEFLNQDWNV